MDYYRKIAALFPKDLQKGTSIVNKKVLHHLAQILFLVLLLQVLLFIAAIVLLKGEYRVRVEEFVKLQQEHTYWVKMVEQYPNAPDVLYNAALTSKNVGNTEEAVRYLDRAIKLDPLFMEARLLRKSLSN